MIQINIPSGAERPALSEPSKPLNINLCPVGK